MPAHLYKTEGLANLEKNPPELTDAGKYGGRVRCATCVWSFSVSTLAENDRFMGTSLPSWATPVSMRLKSEHLGEDMRFDLGLWELGGQIGDEVDYNCFADAFLIESPSDETQAELLIEKNKVEPNFGEPLWKWAGETSDPQQDYWIGLRCHTKGTPLVSGSKTLVLTVLYVLD